MQPYIFRFKRRDVNEGEHDGIEGQHDGSKEEHETGVAIALKPVTSSPKRRNRQFSFLNFFFFWFLRPWFNVLWFGIWGSMIWV